MHPLARKVLERLWSTGDNADLRASTRRPSVLLKPKQCPAYGELPSHADKERFHAELVEAERLGAIAINWEQRAGPRGQIEKISLTSLSALAAFLGMQPTTQKLAQAAAALAPWLGQWPCAQMLLDAWQAGRSPRGVSVDALPKVIDALRLLEHCEQQQYRDVSERRVSALLFHDSKRIEALTNVLDLFTAPLFDKSEHRHAEATLATLGLLKHPSPLLVAGPVRVQTTRREGGMDTTPVLTPYSGFSPRQVVAAEGSPAYLLSVENLTIFHELANGLAGPVRGIVVYTGGYPSPSQLRAYLALVRSFANDLPLWHWGDTDLGGFRIAGLLAEAVARPLRLWNMAIYAEVEVGPNLGKGDVARITALCERWGWREEQQAVVRHCARIEQELQILRLPQ